LAEPPGEKTGGRLRHGDAHLDPAGKGKRTPLTAAVSMDQGKTWEHRKNLYDSPDGGYGFAAIDFAGDRVLLGPQCYRPREGGVGDGDDGDHVV
jgi:hypothetical protein